MRIVSYLRYLKSMLFPNRGDKLKMVQRKNNYHVGYVAIRRLFKRNFNKANKWPLRPSFFKMAETITLLIPVRTDKCSYNAISQTLHYNILQFNNKKY